MKTRKQQKHDMFVTFMASTKANKPKQRSAPATPKILRTLLSLFL